jgi:putative DNA primase/helicase
VAATAEQWDADPWVLCTPAGMVDLRTGALRAQRQEDYATKMTAVGPGGDCPMWRAFLDRVTAGRKELQTFLQKTAGYALTGSTREHALFFLYGTGGNGKSVFLNTVAAILGEYARTAPIETFTQSTGERHPTELAMLRGPRLVVSQETEEGRHWAESRLKAITGGDRIAARVMRGDFFEFTPQFKLVIAGNHRPSLRNVDEAMRRRLHLIPFDVTVPAKERDPDLSGRLKTEWPGILQWTIDGCLLWQREGLQPPDLVRAVTNEYFAAEDALGLWLEERCNRSTVASTASSILFDDWRRWSIARGEPPGTAKRFGPALEARGLRKERTRAGAVFQKIALREFT